MQVRILVARVVAGEHRAYLGLALFRLGLGCSKETLVRWVQFAVVECTDLRWSGWGLGLGGLWAMLVPGEHRCCWRWFWILYPFVLLSTGMRV